MTYTVHVSKSLSWSSQYLGHLNPQPYEQTSYDSMAGSYDLSKLVGCLAEVELVMAEYPTTEVKNSASFSI